MSNPEWMDQINWNELTTTLNNLDADREYQLRGKCTIWDRQKTSEHEQNYDWYPVSDPIGTLTRLKNLAKQAVRDANKIIVDATRHGYKE